jgi:hypothetical protein
MLKTIGWLILGIIGFFILSIIVLAGISWFEYKYIAGEDLGEDEDG